MCASSYNISFGLCDLDSPHQDIIYRAAMAAKTTKIQKCCGGSVHFLQHESSSTKTSMVFTMYLPPQAFVAGGSPCPVLYYLSGLTCTNMNFIEKAGAISAAAQRGIVLICPDTSPRGDNSVPDGAEGEWDFGKGAGFYVDATEAPYATNYNMYTYVTSELPDVVKSTVAQMEGVNVDVDRASVFGHSMGGHGALVVALKNPGKYRSVSAFAPICNPSNNCPWGDKCFGRYLGSVEAGKAFDATELCKSYAGPQIDVLIDQGSADGFLEKQLAPDAFRAAAEGNTNVKAQVRMQEGYDHSYYFISTFVAEHIVFHAERLVV